MCPLFIFFLVYTAYLYFVNCASVPLLRVTGSVCVCGLPELLIRFDTRLTADFTSRMNSFDQIDSTRQ